MKVFIITFCIILLVAFLVYLFLKFLHKNYQKMSGPESFVGDAEPLHSEWAKTIGKQILMEKFRPDMVTPYHHMHYMVSFELADGTQKELEVDKNTYDTIAIPQTGTLVTQNNRLFGFTEEETE